MTSSRSQCRVGFVTLLTLGVAGLALHLLVVALNGSLNAGGEGFIFVAISPRSLVPPEDLLGVFTAHKQTDRALHRSTTRFELTTRLRHLPTTPPWSSSSPLELMPLNTNGPGSPMILHLLSGATAFQSVNVVLLALERAVDPLTFDVGNSTQIPVVC